MKPVYANLKLIIEAPTQEAWDKITEFFGIEWNRFGDNPQWERYGNETRIRIDKENGCFGSELPYKIGFTQHTRLTYSEFEQRFLNMENNKKEIDEFRDDIEQLKSRFSNLINDVLRIAIAQKPVEPTPEKWTVERVMNTVGRGDVHGFLPKSDAFAKLMRCAHWANDGETINAIYHQWNWNHAGTVLPIPAPFKNKDAYDKFFSIDGIDRELKTFFGIE